jgi:hypothetical protein
MVEQLKESRRRKEGQRKTWVWFLLGILAVVSLGLSSCSILNSDPFAMVSGDEQLIVLLRSDEDGNYRVHYEGRDPTDLHSLHVMLGGQILHVDVQQVVILHQDKEVVLESDGTLPSNSGIAFAPDDEFDVRVTYRGQTLGGNYMYGFRIGYGEDSQEKTYDLIAEYDYAIIVE